MMVLAAELVELCGVARVSEALGVMGEASPAPAPDDELPPPCAAGEGKSAEEDDIP